MSTEFPDWAPAVVVALYHERAEFARGAERGGAPDHILQEANQRVEAIERLLTHSEMQCAWAEIRKLETERVIGAGQSVIGAGLRRFAENAEEVSLGPRSPWELLTPSDRSKTSKKLIDDMRALSDTLAGFGVGQSLLPYFQNGELLGMHLFLHGLALTKDIDRADDELYALPLVPQDRRSRWKTGPTLPELLQRVAQELEDSPVYESAVLGQPGLGEEERNRTFVLKRLVRFNRDRYGNDLVRIVRRTASALLDADVTRDDVRNATRRGG